MTATRTLTRFLPALYALGRLAVQAPGVGAQDAPGQQPPRLWTGSAQVNASVFFGNAEQRVFGSRLTLARADTAVEVSVDLQALYGEAAIGGGPRAVTKRLWLGSASVDLRPFARLSPFAFGSAESSLEKRIASRYGLGIGAKQTFVRTDRTESSLSLALMDEHTVSLGPASGPRSQRVRRWSFRGRVRHAFDDRLRASHATFWRPLVGTLGRNYVILSTTELEYKLTRVVGLTVSLLNSYDSEAVRRGAQTYHDGQLLVGAMGRW